MNTTSTAHRQASEAGGIRSPAGERRLSWLVLLIACLIFIGCMFSPPYLMDDVDAVQAQIARNMLESGDWITPRLNGIPYLEKPPLKYWLIAGSFGLLGAHDWVARLPVALSVVLLVWVTMIFGRWAFGPTEGAYAGLVLATCVGLWLFTRILIADVMLTLAITVAMWGFLRLMEEDCPHRGWWFAFWGGMGIGFLLKGLISMVFPAAAACLYLLFRRQLFERETWHKLRPFSGAALTFLLVVPWVAAASLANPPVFDFTMRSGAGEYHGFFWFFFLNEHLFRFLNMRYPRDYNTVPRIYFWLFHLLWLFPWSVYLPGIARLRFGGGGRAGRARLLLACWCGFILLFFSFSTTQEYYTMPAYPALALLLAGAMVREGRWINLGTKLLAGLIGAIALLLAGILWAVRDYPAPGDISRALTLNPDAYTLSLGHMRDLTLPAFAYLKLPLALAAIACLIGAIGAWRWAGRRAFLALAFMMLLFTHAARIALVAFDPYLSSRELALALKEAPPGIVIFDNQYYAFSSVFFYAYAKGYLLNGRVTNLEYGSYAPGAPDVFLNDQQFQKLWSSPQRYYLLVEGVQLERIRTLVDPGQLHEVKQSGGKQLLSNQPL